MSLLCAYADGNWSDTATWAKLIQSANMSTGNLVFSSANTFYSYTLTAANLTDAWRGVMIPFYSSRSNVGLTVTLQEYSGGTWNNTAATGTFYTQASTTQRGRWYYCPFGSPYTPTTTSANLYRVKMVFVSGTASQSVYGASSTFSCCIVSAAPASAPGTGYSSYLRVPGTTGNYAYSADSSALSITGDIDIRVRCSIDAWSTANQAIVGKYVVTGSQGSYLFATGASNKLYISLYDSAGGGATSTSTVAHSFTAGQVGWVRVTYRVSDRRVQFFTAADSASMPSSWTQLGTDLTNTMTNIKDSTAPLEIGSINNGASGGGTGISNATGYFYWVQIRNNVLDDGTGIQFSADFTTKPFGSTSFNESSANAASVVISGASSQDGDNVIITGDATKADGTTNKITVTVDVDATVGSGDTVGTYPYNSTPYYNAITICTGGILKAHRSNNFTFKINYGIGQNLFDSNLDFGTVADPVTGNVTVLMDQSVTSGLATRRGVRYYGIQDSITPYYTTFAGVAKTYVKTTYTSGVGTAASPLVTADAVDWSVGDQICVTGTGTYTTFAHTAPTAATYTAPTGYARSYVELTFASAHSFKVGDRITMSGFTPSTYNATWEVSTVPTTTTLRMYGCYGVSDHATVMGTVSGKNSQHEYRIIKTKNSSTSYVLSTVSSGAEDALQYTHAATHHVYNLSRNLTMVPTYVGSATGNSLWTSDASSSGINTTNYTPLVYDSMRMDYGGMGQTNSLGVLANGNTAGSYAAIMNKCVFWALRGTIVYDSATSHDTWTITDNICAGYYKPGPNAFSMQGYKKTINRLYILDQTVPITDKGRNTYKNVAVIGNNPIGDNTITDSIYLQAGSIGSTFTDCSFQGANTGTNNHGIYIEGGVNFRFINCVIGTLAAHYADDVYIPTGYFADGTFENCTFGSTTLISNYLNAIEGLSVRFHQYQQTVNKHRWYTNAGSAESTGAGLTDTTVKTAGSLNVVLKPENATTGFIWEFKIPSPAGAMAFLNGYLRKNTAFGTDVATVKLWLPGSDTSDTADYTFTADDTTEAYQAFNVYKLFTGTANGLATVRITAISSTAGAYLYVADLYNSVNALNLWNDGIPAKQVTVNDFSTIPAAVWLYPDSNTPVDTTIKLLSDAEKLAKFIRNTSV